TWDPRSSLRVAAAVDEPTDTGDQTEWEQGSRFGDARGEVGVDGDVRVSLHLVALAVRARGPTVESPDVEQPAGRRAKPCTCGGRKHAKGAQEQVGHRHRSAIHR